MTVALIFMGLVVLVLGWQMLQRARSIPVPAQQMVALEDNFPEADEISQIEVRNGAGVEGAAQILREYLVGKGYDVVEVGNHSSFNVEKTQVIDRVGNMDIAMQVAASLGLEEDHVFQDQQKQYFLDASVIIGKDLMALPPFLDTMGSDQEQE